MCAEKYGISRAQQDQHALDSWRRATEAAERGWTAGEIVPVEGAPSGRGQPPKMVTQVPPPALACISCLCLCPLPLPSQG